MILTRSRIAWVATLVALAAASSFVLWQLPSPAREGVLHPEEPSGTLASIESNSTRVGSNATRNVVLDPARVAIRPGTQAPDGPINTNSWVTLSKQELRELYTTKHEALAMAAFKAANTLDDRGEAQPLTHEDEEILNAAGLLFIKQMRRSDDGTISPKVIVLQPSDYPELYEAKREVDALFVSSGLAREQQEELEAYEDEFKAMSHDELLEMTRALGVLPGQGTTPGEAGPETSDD